jgi:phage baseplate assembly protein W
MIGMNATTGRAISGRDHLSQSIGKVIGTPTGSRVQRRRFGSDLFNLIDAPANMVTRVRVYAAIATALMRQEPRLQLRRVTLSDITQGGAAVFDIEGIATEDGAVLSTSVTVPARGGA